MAAGSGPRRNLTAGKAGPSESDHRLQCGNQVGIGGHDDPNVVLAACGHQNEVDGEGDIDALLHRTGFRPITRVSQRACEDDHLGQPAPHSALAFHDRGAARLLPRIRLAAVDPHPDELTCRPPAGYELSQSRRIYLTLLGWSARGTERLAGGSIDVLVVDEENHPRSHGGGSYPAVLTIPKS